MVLDSHYGLKLRDGAIKNDQSADFIGISAASLWPSQKTSIYWFEEVHSVTEGVNYYCKHKGFVSIPEIFHLSFPIENNVSRTALEMCYVK